MHRRSAEAKNAGGAVEEDVFPGKQSEAMAATRTFAIDRTRGPI